MINWVVILVLFAEITWGAVARTPVVAVFEFQTASVDEATGRTFTQRLQGEIQKTGRYNLVDRTQMDAILSEQGYQQSGICNSNECQVQVGQLVGADLLVQGTVAKVGDLFTVTINLVDVETGRIIRSASRDEKGGIETLYSEGLGALARDVTETKTDEPKKSSSHLGWWIGGGVVALAAAGAAVFFLSADPETKTTVTNNTVETEIHVIP